MTVSPVAGVSSGMSSPSADISVQGPHCSEDVSQLITRKCVFSDTGIETGITGGGSGLTERKDG